LKSDYELALALYREGEFSQAEEAFISILMRIMISQVKIWLSVAWNILYPDLIIGRV
jgi:hypothetical protein